MSKLNTLSHVAPTEEMIEAAKSLNCGEIVSCIRESHRIVMQAEEGEDQYVWEKHQWVIKTDVMIARSVPINKPKLIQPIQKATSTVIPSNYPKSIVRDEKYKVISLSVVNGRVTGTMIMDYDTSFESKKSFDVKLEGNIFKVNDAHQHKSKNVYFSLVNN